MKARVGLRVTIGAMEVFTHHIIMARKRYNLNLTSRTREGNRSRLNK